MVAFDSGVFAVKIVVIKGFVLKTVVIERDDQDIVVPLPVAGVAGVNDGLDWIDEVVGVTDRVDIYRVLDFS